MDEEGPLRRYKEATARALAAQGEMEEAVCDRVAALRELRDLGWSLGDISNVTGISRPRLHRMLTSKEAAGSMRSPAR